MRLVSASAKEAALASIRTRLLSALPPLRVGAAAVGLTAFVLLGFWTLTLSLDSAGWGAGIRTALLLGFAALGAWTSRRSTIPRSRILAAALVVAILGLLYARGNSLASTLTREIYPTVDIGTTTIRAVLLWARGIDVYTSAIDDVAFGFEPGGQGFRFFGGFKYGPAMVWAYAPGVLLAGAHGYFITSAVAYLVVVLLVAACARQPRGLEAPLAASLLALLPTALPRELFVSGVNDAVPVALALGAMLARSAGHPLTAGLLLGFSAGSKLLPGLLLLVPLAMSADRRRTAFFGGLALAVAGCLAQALWRSPRELVANLILYQVVRSPDSTSLSYFLPPWLRPASRLAMWTALACISVAPPRWSTHMGRDATRLCTILVLFLLGAGGVHGNYLLWLFPFLAVALASNLWGPRDSKSGYGDRSAAPSA